MLTPEDRAFLLLAGAMARVKRRSATEGTTRITGVAKKPEELRNVRNKIVNVIVDGSVEMVERMVRSVSEAGNVTALRYLWEVAGLFPSDPVTDSEEQDSLARTLLKGLGLSGELPGDREDAEADVESK